jgi:Pregnancy-associated plasma protein-A/Secretion system C-terminal sorting domain
MKKILYLLFLVLPNLLMAQSNGADRLKFPTTPRRYYTQKNYQRLLTIDREMRVKRNFLEQSIPELAFNGLPKEVNIPVVVHILYKSGSDTRNLPKESDIKQQLDITSKDFRQTVKIEKHDADKKEKFSDQNALDTKISFCLATQDSTGRNTSGVLTVPTSVTTWLADDKMKSATTGGSTAWNTEKYLNIWVVSFPDSISGYAQMPAGPAATDGIVIDARYFGKKPNNDKTFPYTEGKTLTHLLAGYLNVYELWSETELCGDDYVEDTPIQNAPTIGCVDYRHVSTCGTNPVAMTMNFMDNTNDECQYMFTNGQKRRMHACLVERGIRYGLVQSGDAQCGQTKANLMSNLKLEIDAAAEFEKSRITWVNNTGTINDYFEIQKLNLLTGTFESLEKVNSHIIEGLENYTSYDSNPIDGENTYRIKLVFSDGSERLSPAKTVVFYSSTGINLYPNPTDDVLNITMKGYIGQDVDILLFDLQGKQLLKRHLEKVQTEVQTLVISDTVGFGQYLVLIQSKGKRDVIRRFTVGK